MCEKTSKLSKTCNFSDIFIITFVSHLLPSHQQNIIYFRYSRAAILRDSVNKYTRRLDFPVLKKHRRRPSKDSRNRPSPSSRHDHNRHRFKRLVFLQQGNVSTGHGIHSQLASFLPESVLLST